MATTLDRIKTALTDSRGKAAEMERAVQMLVSLHPLALTGDKQFGTLLEHLQATYSAKEFAEIIERVNTQSPYPLGPIAVEGHIKRAQHAAGRLSLPEKPRD